MCLDFLVKKEKVKEGYKEFYTDSDGNLLSTYFPSKTLKQEVWHREEDCRPEDVRELTSIGCFSFDEEYPLGFHYYHNLEDAFRDATDSRYSLSRHKVHKVEVKNIRATGLEGHCKVSVAGQIKIGEEVCIKT